VTFKNTKEPARDAVWSLRLGTPGTYRESNGGRTKLVNLAAHLTAKPTGSCAHGGKPGGHVVIYRDRGEYAVVLYQLCGGTRRIAPSLSGLAPGYNYLEIAKA